MTRVRLRSLALLGNTVVATVGLTACTSQTNEIRVERVDSAGVEIVWSTGDDRPLHLTSQLLFTLGGEAAGPQSFYRVAPGLVDADGDGRVYVLNGASAEVVVFDSTGEFVRSMGSQGPGPGELERPGALSVGDDGVVSVFDFSKASLVRYASDGRALSPVSFPYFPAPTMQRHYAMNATRTIVATTDFSRPGDGPAYVLHRFTSTDTVTLRTVSLPAAEMAMYPSCGGGLNLPPVFSAELVWDAHEGLTAVNAAAEYIIDVFERGRLHRSVRRRVGTRIATSALAVEELGDGFRMNFGRGPCVIPPREMVDKRGFADAIQWIVSVAMGPQGDLWILRRDATDLGARVIDVFTEDGAYLGTSNATSVYPLAFLSAGRVVAVTTDSLDVDRVAVYQVEYSH